MAFKTKLQTRHMHRAADAVQMWKLASVALTDAYTDFILSRQAMNCTPAPMDFYRQTAGKFLEWIESQGIARLDEITDRHVRQRPGDPDPCKVLAC